MKKRFCWLVAPCALAACLALSLGSAAWAAVATVSDWTGTNNTDPTNNYGVQSPTAAGGTFQARRPATEADFGDASLTGGPFGFNQDITITGKLDFTSGTSTANNTLSVDPVMFFGFYNSGGTTDTTTNRLGIAVADSTIGKFRFQMVARVGTGSNAANVIQGNSGGLRLPTDAGTTNQSGLAINQGPYDYSLTYLGASTRVLTATITNGTTTVTRSATLGATFNTPGIFDRFGFWQTPSTNNPDTFTFSIYDLNYNGETQVPEPSSFLLMSLAVLFAARARRRG